MVMIMDLNLNLTTKHLILMRDQKVLVISGRMGCAALLMLASRCMQSHTLLVLSHAHISNTADMVAKDGRLTDCFSSTH